MKKILFLSLFCLTSLMAQEKIMSAIMHNVLLKDVDKTTKVLEKFSEDLNQNRQIVVLKSDFKSLVATWKRVETFYLASSMNEDAIDLPRYIDVFHNLKENLHEQMQRVIQSNDEVDMSLYKHSFKTINALEYVLYSGDWSKRRANIAKVIIQSMKLNLFEIKKVYEKDSEEFLTDFKWTNDAIINMLIDSSFKVRDWRVGDIAGLSRKYKGNPDNSRGEYFLSKNSTLAIKAILLTHKAIMNSNEYDFGDMLVENEFKEVVQLIQEKIDESLRLLSLIKNDNFENPDVKKLYKSLDELHRAYYLSLVNAVGVSTKILDADGD